MKSIVARDNLLTYPDSNEEFKIHTNDRDLQLGAVIRQKGKPIDFYSRKLTDTQIRYTVTERELLNSIENLNKYRTILLHQILRNYTDYKNLTCKKYNTDILLRWRLILEEYGTDIEYTKGDKNVLAAVLPIFTLNTNTETTHKSTYKK